MLLEWDKANYAEKKEYLKFHAERHKVKSHWFYIYRKKYTVDDANRQFRFQ